MRVTSDKSLRLVLSTFKNLREELCHLQDDLGVSEVVFLSPRGLIHLWSPLV